MKADYAIAIDYLYTRIFIRQIGKATLIVQCSKRFERSSYIPHVQRATKLLEQIVDLGNRIR